MSKEIPGMPGTPHRCNSRMDDFLKGLLRLPPKIAGTASVFYRCMKSEPGQEPKDKYIYLSELNPEEEDE
jgi:hypothetical protein